MSKKELSFEDLAKRIAKSLEKDDTKTIAEWIIKNELKTDTNTVYSFKNREYLIDIVNDLSPRQCIPSSAQVGKTILMYMKALLMTMRGMNVCYTLPTQDLSDLMTKSKLDMIINNNPVFKDAVRNGNLQNKTIGNNMMFMIYTFGSMSVGFSTDLNIFDEVERSNPDTVSKLSGRQLASKYKWEWYMSNPSVPDAPLDRIWKSKYCDQKHWTIKPKCCNGEQILNYDGIYGFKGNVCKIRKKFVCQHCDSELTMEDRTQGRWVARYPERQKDPSYVSGYWLHYLMVEGCTVNELIRKEEEDKMNFYNFYLGLPYSGSDVKASKEVILANTIKPVTLDRNVCMGIDTGYGTGHHYTIGSDNVVFRIGTAKDFDEIDNLIAEYKVRQIVVDNGPETENANKLCERYPGMVLKSYYNSNMEKEEVKYDEERYMVYSSRHRLFDRYIREINQGAFKFAFDEKDPLINKYGDHFATLSCVVEPDKTGNMQLRWIAPSHSADHYSHSFLYWRLSVERLKYISPQYKSYSQEEIGVKIASQDRDDWLFDRTEEVVSDDWYNL
jgi:hypothetical protein